MLQGQVAVRIQRFRKAEGGPDFKKGYFELEFGLDVQGVGYVPFGRMPEWSLLESKSGELYAAPPSRPMIQRNNEGTYSILEDGNGVKRYSHLFYFIKDSEEATARITPESFEFKNLINEAAINAYRSLGQERAGVGSGRRAAPAGVASAIDGAERGVPGLSDDDELPF